MGRQVGLSYHLILSRSLFHKHDRRTDGPTNRPTDRPTNGPTTVVLELLRAAKKGFSGDDKCYHRNEILKCMLGGRDGGAWGIGGDGWVYVVMVA